MVTGESKAGLAERGWPVERVSVRFAEAPLLPEEANEAAFAASRGWRLAPAARAAQPTAQAGQIDGESIRARHRAGPAHPVPEAQSQYAAQSLE